MKKVENQEVQKKKDIFISVQIKFLTQLQTMIDGSKSSIKIMTDQGGLGLLAECKEQLFGVIRRNLDIKLIVPTSQICSESYRTIPDGVEIKTSEIVQNCFIFDETELLMINNNNGKGAIFSSTDVLGIHQEKVFSSIWKNSIKTKVVADMTKAEAHEIYKNLFKKLLNETGLMYILKFYNDIKKTRVRHDKVIRKNE